MEIFDTHAHYDDPAFDADREELLEQLPQTGVCGVITAGTNLQTSKSAAALAARYDYIYFAAGVHPEDVATVSGGDIERIGQIIKSGKRAVAVGEIGLDYHCDADRDLQRLIFEEQLRLAAELDLPVVIHDRDAHGDTMDILRKYKPRGALHCFSGSAEMARELVTMGMYIGFTGVVTFKNNKKAAEVLAAVPNDRILVETDCPYMAPEPLRGRRCDSSMVRHIITRIAGLKGVDPEKMGAVTAANARRLYVIK